MSKKNKNELGVPASKAKRSASASKSSAKKRPGFPATSSREMQVGDSVRYINDTGVTKLGHGTLVSIGKPSEWSGQVFCVVDFDGCGQNTFWINDLRHESEQEQQARNLALKFHDTYERLAPSFGYTTREDTREFNPRSSNGKLMIAVCEDIIGSAIGIATKNPQRVSARIRSGKPGPKRLAKASPKEA